MLCTVSFYCIGRGMVTQAPRVVKAVNDMWWNPRKIMRLRFCLCIGRKLGTQNSQVVKGINNMWWNPRNSMQVANAEGKACLLAKKAAKKLAAATVAALLPSPGPATALQATPRKQTRRKLPASPPVHRLPSTLPSGCMPSSIWAFCCPVCCWQRTENISFGFAGMQLPEKHWTGQNNSLNECMNDSMPHTAYVTCTRGCGFWLAATRHGLT